MFKVKIVLKRLLWCINVYTQYNSGYSMFQITKCRRSMLCVTSDGCWDNELFTEMDIIYNMHDTILDTVFVT